MQQCVMDMSLRDKNVLVVRTPTLVCAAPCVAKLRACRRGRLAPRGECFDQHNGMSPYGEPPSVIAHVISSDFFYVVERS